MREIAYLIFVLAMAAPATALEAMSKTEPGPVARRGGEAMWLDLRVPANPPRGAQAVRLILPAQRPDCSGVCGHGPSPTAETDTRGRAAPDSFLATATHGALAWALPGGLGVLATGAFGQGIAFGQATSPVDTAVPVARTAAALSLDLAGSAGVPLRLNLAVESTWKLDGADRMAHPVCGLRLGIGTDWMPGFSLQAPCGPVGHFGFGVRGRF